MRRILAGLLAAGILVSGGLVLDAAPAVGAPTAVHAADAPPDFTPSGSKAKKYMINILGKVLGDAMPDKWRAEQLANEYQYNAGWETLEAQFGTNPANPDYMGKPDSYDDYVIRKHEQDLKGGKGSKPLAAPATKTSKLTKAAGVAGAAAVAITGMPIGFSIGNLATAFFGFDAESGICAQPPGALTDIMANIAGADCNAWAMSGDAIAAANADVDYQAAWGSLCTPGSTWCAQVLGQFSYIWKASSSWHVYTVLCLARTAGTGYQPPSPYSFYVEQPAYTGNADPTYVSNPSAYTGALSGSSYRAYDGTVNKSGAAYVPNPAACPTGTDLYLQSDISRNAVTGIVYDPRELPIALGVGLTSDPDAVAWREPDFDPARVLTCTIEGDDGHTYTAQSAAYHESDGTIASPECPALPDGVRPTNVSVDDSVGGNLYSQDVTDAYASWWDTYPECRTGACKLDLIKTGGSFPVSCFDLDQECRDWFTDPAKADHYECHYGIHTVELDECNVYAGLWQPGRIEIGAPYSDPMTGDWSGGVNAPSPDTQALGQGIQNPDVPRSCNGLASMGFDPVAWVMRPVQCALEWAFVPRAAVVGLAGEQLTDRFEDRAPGQLAAMISGWSFTPNMTGCSRTVDLPVTAFGVGDETVTLWDFCEGSTLAPIGVISRTLTAVAFAVLVFLATKRAVAGMVDYR